MSIPSHFPYDLINFFVKLAYHFSMGKKKITPVFLLLPRLLPTQLPLALIPNGYLPLGPSFPACFSLDLAPPTALSRPATEEIPCQT
jgi:hypothetical protein